MIVYILKTLLNSACVKGKLKSEFRDDDDNETTEMKQMGLNVMWLQGDDEMMMLIGWELQGNWTKSVQVI